MRWTTTPYRAKERANISCFIFIMFFAVFGFIILTELLPPKDPVTSNNSRSRSDHLQGWDSRSSAGGEESESPPPALIPLDAVWQPVGGTRFRFYVYSAYVERRTIAAVRVIAATKTRGADSVMCRLWLLNNRTLTLKAKVKAIRENWNLKFSATYVLCLLADSGVKPHETVGASVAVLATDKLNSLPTNLLIVQDTEPKPGIEENLHICVKPFHFSFNRFDWLVEWFEMNRLLGASHFYMYNQSLSSSVECLLEDYRKKGLVTLLSWQLPILSKVEIRTEGQFAAFNDCLYRSMSRTGWLLVIDVDEVVFPRRERTLPALLTSLRASYQPRSKAPSAFLFRNAFFYLKWEDDPEANSPLLSSRKTRRWSTPHSLKNRSKYALRPRDAVELGNHFVWELAPGASSVGVNTDRALLHHYRINCEFGGLTCLQVPSTIDRTAHRWKDELMERVTTQRKRLEAAGCVQKVVEQ
ncbi:uncharacterized protein LOC118264116 isoform X1 [Spodoptera frugiperda]|uniref:Glycosyltransferase family 92 protein n=1 Tax=Spodoptera frugiperda TaxID=7108 RepID=A0A9R0CXB0_SPOFR|nr:uncharacterized protein LOC118264116 isoform X1 [Spodoptera frugiperda]